MKTLKKLLSLLIENAKVLGIEHRDIKYVEDFLNNNEFELCFDSINYQNV